MKWKTWKKFGVIAMAVIMGAAFLAGCGSDSNNASSANKKELTYSNLRDRIPTSLKRELSLFWKRKAIKLPVRICLIYCRPM
nr:hypothetical protein [uncultured Megasphaera sp.]